MQTENKIKTLETVVSGFGLPLTFVPIAHLHSLSAVPSFTDAKFVKICSGVQLDLLTSERIVEKVEILRLLPKGKFIFLENFSQDFGLVKLERPLSLDEMLALLALDVDGLIVYGLEYSFVFALDFDITGHVLELTCAKDRH